MTNLFLPCFLLFGVQELLRNATDIFLRTKKKTPELFHELPGVFLHESCQLDLNLFPIHFLKTRSQKSQIWNLKFLKSKLQDPKTKGEQTYLSVEESVNEIYKNFVFKSE